MVQRVELRLPNLDVSGVPITASSWHAAVGQRVIEGDRLVEILAGDAVVDLPAPASGVLAEKCVEIDQPLATGQVLAVIEAEDVP
jgi:pyruvate/2-oxoglutarate dehydrogenase complex dihydrolipoamide acyltransferase (E2) component